MSQVRMMSAGSENPTPSPGLTGPALKTEMAAWREGESSTELPHELPGCEEVLQKLSLLGAIATDQVNKEENPILHWSL